MTRLLQAKADLCEIFPVVRFGEEGFLAVRDKATDTVPVAVVSLDHDERPVFDFGARTLTFAEIEALIAYGLAIDPNKPEGLFMSLQTPNPHDQP